MAIDTSTTVSQAYAHTSEEGNSSSAFSAGISGNYMSSVLSESYKEVSELDAHSNELFVLPFFFTTTVSQDYNETGAGGSAVEQFVQRWG